MAKFGGKPGKFKNCEITVNTGRLELNKINRYYQYHGNVSFFNTHEYGYSGGFNMSGTGFMQYEPFLFEGFTTFDGFFYWFRDYGLKRKITFLLLSVYLFRLMQKIRLKRGVHIFLT